MKLIRVVKSRQNLSLMKYFGVAFGAILFGCGGQEATSTPSGVPAGQMISPVNGALHVGIATPITVFLDSLQNGKSVSNSDMTLLSKDGKAIAGSVEQKGKMLVFKPTSALLPNTSYTLEINSNLVTAGNTSALPTKTPSRLTIGSFTTQEPYKIFLATDNFHGDFKGSGDAISGVIGADNRCMQSVNRPADFESGVIYRAMLASDSRYACDANACGAGHANDWVLAPNTAYYSVEANGASGSLIGTTTNEGIFSFPLTATFSNIKTNTVWTGLSSTWHTDSTCHDWTSHSDDKNGSVGSASATSSDAISYNKSGCDNKRYLYCVQQAKPVEVPLKIFVATHNGDGYHGDLKASGNGANGVDGADNHCNASTDKPFESWVFESDILYKALIASKDRFPCDSKGCGNGHTKDWVLKANTSYYTAESKPIGTTTKYAIFSGDLIVPLSTLVSKAWTGLAGNWSTASNRCNDWTGNGNVTGRYGLTNATDFNSIISHEDADCSGKRFLYCVEQAKIEMVVPALADRSTFPVDGNIDLDFNADVTEASLVGKLSLYEVDTGSSSSDVHMNSTPLTMVPFGLIPISLSEYRMDPTANLLPNRLYEVKASSVVDIYGNMLPERDFYFFTGEDVQMIAPQSKELAELDTPVTLLFPDTVPKENVNSSTFIVTQKSTKENIPCAYSVVNNTATCKPNKNLEAFESYTVQANVQNAHGSDMIYTSTFTTSDVMANIVLIYPTATTVSPNVEFSLRSEYPVQEPASDNSRFRLFKSGSGSVMQNVAVDVTWEDSQHVKVKPKSQLPAGDYTVTAWIKNIYGWFSKKSVKVHVDVTLGDCPKLIYEAYRPRNGAPGVEGYNGDLRQFAVNMLNGSTWRDGAEYICNNDLNKPMDYDCFDSANQQTPRHYQAMIASDYHDDFANPPQQYAVPNVNWQDLVLFANQEYRNQNRQPLGTTNLDAIFPSNNQLANLISPAGRFAWTGMGLNWGPEDNCWGWSSAYEMVSGVTGITDGHSWQEVISFNQGAGDGILLTACSERHSLYCVQTAP